MKNNLVLLKILASTQLLNPSSRPAIPETHPATNTYAYNKYLQDKAQFKRERKLKAKALL